MYPEYPEIFNMVNMGGVDLTDIIGKTYVGLYNRVLAGINSENHVVPYNWFFAKVPIPPFKVTCEVVPGVSISLNEIIFIHADNTISIPSMSIPYVTESLTALENGIYSTPAGVDGFDPVTVSVPAPTLVPLLAESNGTYRPQEGTDGFNPVTVDVPAPTLVNLLAQSNGTYLPQEGTDGFSRVDVSVQQAVLQPLSITTNGTYTPPSGVDGFSSVVANVQGISADLAYYLNNYGLGSEYSGYIYGTSVVTNCHMVLLSDMSQNSSATTGTLSQSYRNFSAIVLQGIYNKQRTSQYNTTMCYFVVNTGHSYWAGMKDRNNSYTCYVVLTGDTTFALSGNKQVLIYGIP